MPSTFWLHGQAAADIETPPSGVAAVFLDSATGEMSWKDDAGAVHSFVGTTGAPGAAGPAGPTGATGPQGPTGRTGLDGDDGADGAPGVTGLQGPTGLTGAQGQMAPIFMPEEHDIEDTVRIPGPVGPQGATGATGPSGSGGGQTVVLFSEGEDEDRPWMPPAQPIPPAVGVRVTHSTTQSLTSGAVTILAFDTEKYDTDGFHDNVTNNSRLTCPAGKAGLYHVSLTLAIQANSGGGRGCQIDFNPSGGGGSTPLTVQYTNANTDGGNTHVVCSTDYYLNPGDYFVAKAFQTSGGTLNVISGAEYSPAFCMHRVGS